VLLVIVQVSLPPPYAAGIAASGTATGAAVAKLSAGRDDKTAMRPKSTVTRSVLDDIEASFAD
jgi:hypothetical protein